MADTDSDGDDLSPAEAWRTLGQRHTLMRLAHLQGELMDALYDLEEAIEDDRRPTADEIAAARRALDVTRAFVEDDLAPLTDGVESWDDGAGSTIPYGVLREQVNDYDERCRELREASK